MCTVIIRRRPGDSWPLLFAANRDEMAERSWLPPARHWPEHPTITAGLDVLAGGSWLGINDDGVIAAVLNRINTLGPAAGRQSRGTLPLLALEHATAEAAAAALGAFDPGHYRAFNLIIADAESAFWVRATEAEPDGHPAQLSVEPLPPGLSMITAYDRNDLRSPRIRRYLPLFEQARDPDPDAGDWRDWLTLMAERSADEGAGPGGGMTVVTATGFGTVSSSLIALPAASPVINGHAPIWLFASGRPGEAEYRPVSR